MKRAYIDEYDVERGDFIPNTIGDKALYFFEAGYMLVSLKKIITAQVGFCKSKK